MICLDCGATLHLSRHAPRLGALLRDAGITGVNPEDFWYDEQGRGVCPVTSQYHTVIGV